MNERIRELAEQAWDATAVSPQFGHPISFAEKFSELIVRECAQKLENDGMVEVAMEIKHHFGIEQ